jgi:hypothetical protein
VPSDETVLGVWGLHDTHARVARRESTNLTIRCGPISGNGVQLGAYWIYDNRNVPGYVHGLVDRVLSPIARGHAIARVTLSRF